MYWRRVVPPGWQGWNMPQIVSSPKDLIGNRSGASAVEFAIIAPFLLLLVAGILAYGSIFATSLSLQQLAAETARATIGGLNDSERQDLAEAHFALVSSQYPMLRVDAVSFGFDSAAEGQQSRVTLSYSMANHPAYALEQLIPLPPSPLSYSMIITDGDGADT
jgi:Flp pilus assembly protein TadG